jgi:hypothetical protein
MLKPSKNQAFSRAAGAKFSLGFGVFGKSFRIFHANFGEKLPSFRRF